MQDDVRQNSNATSREPSAVDQAPDAVNEAPSLITKVFALIREHKAAAGCVSIASFVWLAFAQNLINAEIACSINFAQPSISDACGYLGLGDKPKRVERLAWEDIRVRLKDPSPENCDALQQHIRSFPDGAFAAEAARLAGNPNVRELERWEPERRTLPLFVGMSETGFATEQSAKADARQRALSQTMRQCEGYTQGAVYRVTSTQLKNVQLSCDVSGGMRYCSLEAESLCSLERRTIEEQRLCGTQPPKSDQ